MIYYSNQKNHIRHLNISICLLIAATLFSCKGNTDATKTETPTAPATPSASETQTAPAAIRDKVLTTDEQKALTPDMVIEGLKAGNKNFIANAVTARDHSSMVIDAAAGQFPKAVILSCLDSRIPVEDVFDKGIGDLFIGRVAGNIVNEDLLGSMEFGCKVAGAKLIVVVGHSSCGAVKAAIDDVKLGNITALLSKIRPAVAKSQDYAGDKTTKNDSFVTHVAKNNVLGTIESIRQRSAILKEMADKGEIKIVGAFYDMKTGRVEFL
jgi:carbonic anhydrase